MKEKKPRILSEYLTMKKNTFSFDFLELDSAEELTPGDRLLFEHARKAVGTSYAPYSRYHVGAAVRLANGEIISGSNQENISFPAGLCAERVAIYAAASRFPDVAIESIAVTAKAELFAVHEPVPPCGMCRQSIMEFEQKHGQPIRIILGGEQGKVLVIKSMQNLLPFAFHAEELKKT